MTKVGSSVWETAVSTQAPTEFLVMLTTQADLSATSSLSTKLEMGQYVYTQLTAVAQATQPTLITIINNAGAAYRPFWIANMIWVKGDSTLISTLAQQAEVAQIYANPEVQLQLPETAVFPNPTLSTHSIEWNVSHIDAPQAWNLGFTGQGVVIGGQDTGYDWDHAALKNQYRGWNGSSADHNYNWHDAITTGSNPVCGINSPEPCDDIGSSHGTHTMGTMVGDDGGSNQIGIAPDAKWIGCRNMNSGFGTPATYADCYEWFVAPYPIGGDPMADGDPAKAPHVINNSWSCPASEGCTDPNVLLTVVDNVRAAGIVTVHAAGNSGSSCNSINTAAAIYDSSLTIGNTTSSDTIAGSSSRGPVTVDGSNRLKPDLSAPGSSIRSAMRDDTYGTLTGTSMAAPHVAGLVALLISSEPTLAGQVDTIEQILRDTAVHLTTTQGCGGDSSTAVPNHVYGYGRIDAYSAIISLFPNKYYFPVVQNQ
ncbi:MAG: S8 family serine peptidase [Chloroflexi bacterium]|nr:S8 family serine peptidase [Chloroflexota bacterium]